jgi:hypothetical protein
MGNNEATERGRRTKEGRIAVYTAIFGKKDTLRNPRVVSDRCDYICFTDQPMTSSVWDVRRVPRRDPDPTRSAREYKILAHQYLPEYEMSVWVDGNIDILGDPNEMVKKWLSDTSLAVLDHRKSAEIPIRNLSELRDRLLAMEREGKHQDDADIIERQYQEYLSSGFPDDNGMAWTCVLLRKHQEPQVREFLELWWRELSRWSKRDQMSFNYAAWKTGLPFRYIPEDAADNPYFKRLNHRLSPKQRLVSYLLGAKKRFARLLG